MDAAKKPSAAARAQVSMAWAWDVMSDKCKLGLLDKLDLDNAWGVFEWGELEPDIQARILNAVARWPS